MSEKPIRGVVIDTVPDSGNEYNVGRGGCTDIKAITKPGMYSDIPYIQVWLNDEIAAEFCQHNIVGVYY